MNKALSPQRMFLLIALPLGLCFVLIIFPFRAPDEPNHFYRAFHVSEGKVLAKRVGEHTGDQLPRSLQQIIGELSDAHRYEPKRLTTLIDLIKDRMFGLNPEVRQFVAFDNTALYPPVSYLPQAVGILVGKLADLPPLILLYLGRLFNLIGWCTLMYWSIRLSPIHRWTITATSLLPMQLHQAASLSGDAVLIGLSYLFSAVVLRYAFCEQDGSKLGWPGMVSMGLLSVSVTLCKGVYIPLVLLVLLIPRRHFGSTKQYVLFLASCFTLNVAALLGWSVAIRELLVQMNPYVITDPVGQISFILQHPLTYLGVLMETVIRVSDSLALGFIGLLGWLEISFPPYMYITYGVLLLGIALCDGTPSVRLSLWHRVILVGVMISATLLIFTGLYIQWNSVAHPYIIGLQGRYFLPLAVPMFLVVYKPDPVGGIGPTALSRVVGAIALTSLGFALYLMTMAY